MCSIELNELMPTAKKDVYYCKTTGGLSYKGIPNQKLPSVLDNFNSINPLSLKFIPGNSTVNFLNINHINYLSHRNEGISKIKYLSKKFKISSILIYKSINYMNEIYLNNNISSTENLEDVAIICVLLALKFNNSRRLDDNLKNFKKYVIKKVENWNYLEVKCLKFLNYDLGKYSAYDYLYLFFGMGIIFTESKYSDICENFHKSEEMLEILVNDIRVSNFSQYVLALSIIYNIFENDYAFDLNIFKYIYGVDFSKKKYINCIKMIKIILCSCNLLFNNNFEYINNNTNIYFINNLTYIDNDIKLIIEDRIMKENENKNKKSSKEISISL